MMIKISKAIAVITGIVSLGACGAVDRMGDIGKAPEMTPITEISAPATQRSITYPMGQVGSQPVGTTSANSLYRTDGKSFFADQRASRVGDLLTVKIDITDSAQVANTTARSRASSDDSAVNNLLGFEALIPRILPGGRSGTAGQAFDNGSLTDFESNSNYTGNGTVNRSESINLTVAATVTHVLPNGNMVIQGYQEVRVNFEKRELRFAGIIRPQDITKNNTIMHTQIAEARIVYGGKGQLTDVQQPRYGSQFMDIIWPF